MRITKELLHRSLADDFALLFTESEFELAEHIDTVCLPQVLLIINLIIVLIVITMMEIVLVIVLWMDIILVSNVTARRRIPLLPMFCHWLGQRPVWG